MKIAFFLTPKAECAWVSSKSTVRQAIEKMEHWRYSAVPVLTSEGVYESTLTEGDLLWFLKQHPTTRFDETGRFSLADVERRRNVIAVRIDAEIDDLLALSVRQNFIPVVDDRGVFIGLVRRTKILERFYAEALQGRGGDGI
jgi:CBS-domain-containing membrane protein